MFSVFISRQNRKPNEIAVASAPPRPASVPSGVSDMAAKNTKATDDRKLTNMKIHVVQVVVLSLGAGEIILGHFLVEKGSVGWGNRLHPIALRFAHRLFYRD